MLEEDRVEQSSKAGRVGNPSFGVIGTERMYYFGIVRTCSMGNLNVDWILFRSYMIFKRAIRRVFFVSKTAWYNSKLYYRFNVPYCKNGGGV